MDITDHQLAYQAVLKKLWRANNYKLLFAPSKRICFSGPYRCQNWSFPDSLIYYITQNPSTIKVYQKMVKCCKYFYIKNPMLVASRLSISAEHCQVFFGNEIITFPPAATKFWVIDGFALSPNAFSSPISKIYHCTATELCIQEQILSFNEFCFISSNTNDIHFAKVTVKNDDGSIVAFEKLVETLPKVKAIFYRADSAFPSFTKETIHELVKIPHFFKIIKLHVFDVSEAFDLEAFYNFIKSNKFTNIQISFNESISERYKKRIGEIIDEIIATEGSFTYKPPHITFVGNDPDRWNKLRSISAKFLGHSF